MYIYYASFLFATQLFYFYTQKEKIENYHNVKYKEAFIIVHSRISMIKCFILSGLHIYQIAILDYDKIDRVNFTSPVITTALNIYMGGAIYDILVDIFNQSVKQDMFFHHVISFTCAGLARKYNTHIYYVTLMGLTNINNIFLCMITINKAIKKPLQIDLTNISYVLTYSLFRILLFPYIIFIHHQDKPLYLGLFNQIIHEFGNISLLFLYVLQIHWATLIYKNIQKSRANIKN
tara:strand:- start:15 stop:716 length:702 start_codon:yes stop_codon:yes gene_type:complete